MDLPEDNPYLKKESLVEIPPQQRMLVPPAPPKPPLGPKMTYAERLKVAKQAKAADSGSDSGPGSAAPAAAAAPAASAAPSRSPEKVKPAPEVAAARPPPSPPAAAAAAAAAASATPSTRLLEQEVPESALLGEDAAKAKVRSCLLPWWVKVGSHLFVLFTATTCSVCEVRCCCV